MCVISIVFFFNDTATTEIYTLSLHDALPIYDDPGPRPGDEPLQLVQPRQVEVVRRFVEQQDVVARQQQAGQPDPGGLTAGQRSEEHTSELQSRQYLVCRLLLEKKKKSHTDLL